MAGETEEKPSGWTVDTLHVHFRQMMSDKDRRDEQRFEAQQQAVRDALVAQEKAVNAALLAAQQAVTKAEMAAEKRFDSVNEFRATLSDQANMLMPRSEATVLLAAQDQRLTVVEKRTQEDRARSRGVGDAWGYLVAAVGLAGAVVAVVVAVNS